MALPWRSCSVEAEAHKGLGELQISVTKPVQEVRAGVGLLSTAGDRGLLQGKALSTVNLCGHTSLPTGFEEGHSPPPIGAPRTAGAATLPALPSLSSPPIILWSWADGMEGTDSS